MKLMTVLTGKPEPTPAKSGMTGHFKKPTDGPITVTTAGLTGDTICDLENHGGVDQAVYLFGEPDRQWWETHLDRDVPPGFFGENLLISELNTGDLHLGDILELPDLLLQITSARIPCLTYATHIGDSAAMRDFYNAERPGAYARVLRTGSVTADQIVKHIPFVGEQISIAENLRAKWSDFNDPDFLRRALLVPAHHELHAIARCALGDNS